MGVISNEGLPSVTLYCRDGGSDKVYQAYLVRAGTGYLVRYAYGRRGTQLKVGMKTPRLVPLDEATHIWNQLVREKRGRGYRDADAQTLSAPPASEESSAKRTKRRIDSDRPRYSDPVLGTLTWDGDITWSTRASVPGFGDKVSLRFDAPNAAKRRNARTAF